jgi:hypothetical protein
MRLWSKLTPSRSKSRRTHCRNRGTAGRSVRAAKFIYDPRIHMRPEARPRRKLVRRCQGASSTGGMGNDENPNRCRAARLKSQLASSLPRATESAPLSAPSLGRVGNTYYALKLPLFQWLAELGWSECLVGVHPVKISATHRLGGSARRVIARADETFGVRFDAAAQARLEARPWPQTFGAERDSG